MSKEVPEYDPEDIVFKKPPTMGDWFRSKKLLMDIILGIILAILFIVVMSRIGGVT